MTQHASTAVKMAALALAAPALLLPMKAAAQQMALGGPTTGEIVAVCSRAHRPNQGAIAECIVRRGGEENQRAAAEASKRADVQSARADAGEERVSCANQIKTGVGNGAFKAERLKEILAGRPAKDVDLCKVLAQLKS